MKTSNSLILLILTGIFILFFACNKTDLLSSSTDTANEDNVILDVAQAKKYYAELKKDQGTTVTDIHAPHTQTAKKRPNYKYAIWKKAYAGQTDKTSFVELPLLYNQRPSILFNKK